MTSVKVRAICVMTMVLRSCTPRNAVPARSRSDDMTERRPACQAGARPLNTPDARLAATAKSSRRESMDACKAVAAVLRGSKAMRARTTNGAASADPRIPPTSAISRLSARSCRPSRPRDAPSANRVPISRSRADPRARNSPVTFKQARPSSTAVAANRNHNGCREPPPQSGMALRRPAEHPARKEKPLPAFCCDHGKSARRMSSWSIPLNHGSRPACAVFDGHALFSRPNTCIQRVRRSNRSVEARNDLRRHRGRYPERGHIAPTSIPGSLERNADHRHRVWRFTSTVRPTDLGTPASCVCQKSYESTATGFAPGASSSFASTLPSAASQRREPRSMLPETSSACAGRCSPPTERFDRR